MWLCFSQKKVLIGLAGEVVFVAIIVAITMLTLHTHTKRSLMVGVICDIFNILMYCSPLTIMVRMSLFNLNPVNSSNSVFVNGPLHIYNFSCVDWFWQKKVITTKSVKYMPFYLSLTNFLNGSVWTAYALIKFDIYILVISISIVGVWNISFFSCLLYKEFNLSGIYSCRWATALVQSLV